VGKVPPCLASKSFLAGVTAPRGPHIAYVRSRPFLGGESLVTPCGAVLSSVHPYLRVCKLLRRLAFPQWRWFESLGMVCCLRV
jgi:hypothetical protein